MLLIFCQKKTQFKNVIEKKYKEFRISSRIFFSMISSKIAYPKSSKILILFSLVFIIVSIGYLNISLTQLRDTVEPVLLLLICTLLVILIANSKMPLSDNKAEMFYLLFICYVFARNIFTNTFDISSISFLLFFVILYYGLKLFFSLVNNSAYSYTFYFSTAIILFVYIVFSIYHCYIEKETLANLFTPNNSIFSILLASQIAFITPLWFNNRNGKRRFKLVNWICLFAIIASLLLLGLTKGRAGWIGLLLAVFYIWYQYLSNTAIKRTVLFLLFPIVGLVTYLLFLYKSDSSNGRLLIYKVSANILRDNWLLGIGHGQFKVRYNEYQAVYFSTHSIDSKEALLADNSFYAFNDFFQVIIENGLIGFLLLAAMIFLLAVQIKKEKINSENKYLFTASVASLICITAGSLFSYSLQIFPVVFQAMLCLSIINSCPCKQKPAFYFCERSSNILKTGLLFLNIVLLIHFGFYFAYKTKSGQAFELKRTGFKQQSIKKYQELNSSYIIEGNVLYLYAQELFYSNQLAKAAQILKTGKKYYSSNEVYKLSATVENELQNYTQAEKDYKTAIYMVPNRMLSRSNLLDFYLERKDTSSAIYWANSIIHMPVKVPSSITNSIQQYAKETLIRFNIVRPNQVQ